MAMLDLQRAFDTVDHAILLSKLKAVGFNNTAVRWVSSYLKDRKQVVDVGGTMSHPWSILGVWSPTRECTWTTLFPLIYKSLSCHVKQP